MHSHKCDHVKFFTRTLSKNGRKCNHFGRSLEPWYIINVCVCVCVCVYIYIYILVLSKLTQIHFNGTNFFNARLTQHVFPVWPVAQPVVGEMEKHSVANLATLQTPLATFFPSKKHPNLVSENHQDCRANARSCSPSATHTPLSLCVCSVQRAHWTVSLSLCVCSVQRAHLSLSLSLCLLSARQGEEQRFNSVKHRYYVASLILHASIAEIIAQLLSLSYVYLISSDDGAIIMIFFEQINILEGRAGYVLMGRVSVTISYSFRCLTTETVKYTSFIENLASSKYSMWAKIGRQM